MPNTKAPTRDIFITFKRLLVDHVGVVDDDVTLDASLEDDLGLDSLDAVEVLMAVESEFDTDIIDVQAECVKTVRDAVILIASCVGQDDTQWRRS